MPNHVHGIVFLNCSLEVRASPTRLTDMVGGFKAAVSRGAGSRVWQRSFYDRIIRNDTELEALCEYIRNNPSQWAEDRENPSTPLGRGKPLPYELGPSGGVGPTST